MLVRMARSLIVARLAQRVALVPISSTTASRPEGAVVNAPAAVPTCLGPPLTPSNVEPCSAI
jgi:hypothetical protein